MKKVLLLSLLILGMFHARKSNAQGTEVTLDPTQITVSIFPLMANLEAKVSENRSVTIGGGLIYTYYPEEINGDISWEPFSTPFITGSFRNYYERKRVKKDNLRNNSGNYYGIYTWYQFDTIITESDFTLESDLNSFLIGPVWGFQRNYASGIHLDLSLGLGYQVVEETIGLDSQNGITFVGGFELGYRFNK